MLSNSVAKRLCQIPQLKHEIKNNAVHVHLNGMLLKVDDKLGRFLQTHVDRIIPKNAIDLRNKTLEERNVIVLELLGRKE